MNELDKVMGQIEREVDKIEKAQNRMKLLSQKKNKLKRSADTQRKVKKGGVLEAFEREITGRQEDTDNDLIYAFLDYVLSDNRNREKLKELTEIHLREQEIDNTEVEKTENPNDENAGLEYAEAKTTDTNIEDEFLESED